MADQKMAEALVHPQTGGALATAKAKEAQSADARNAAQRGLAEAQTAQACVATLAQAKAANIDVNLPKVCDKYVQKAREEKK